MKGKAGESFWQYLFQFLRQFNSRLMGKVCKNHMLQFIDLLFQGLIDFFIAMPKEIAPPR